MLSHLLHLCHTRFAPFASEPFENNSPHHSLTKGCPQIEYEYCKHLHLQHGLSPEDLEEPEVRAPKANSQGKIKQFKCKQCDLSFQTKIEFWHHGRTHIKPEKLLFCPKCIFVTEYKHHLEYHLRNHYGAKPFKCTECNYACVNKSMLNSHSKSHNNVYQYRCANCTYATKYCHSLKLHLKKYDHKPAMVLNQDGTPNPPMLDVFGNKRGPKGKGKNGQDDHLFPPSLLPQFSGFPQLPTSPFPQHFLHMMQMQQQLNSPKPQAHVMPFKEEERGVSPPSMMMQDQMRCEKCDFITSSIEVHKNHMLLHATSERGALHHLLTSPLQPKRDREEMPLSFAPKLSSPRPPFSRNIHHSFMDRPESPNQPLSTASPFLPSQPPITSASSPFLQNSLASFPFANSFLQNLVPNPAIQMLMEKQRKQDVENLPSSPDSMNTASPCRKEEAPLPPNKRLKPDIFASLYSRMSELEKTKSAADSPPMSNGGGVLDLSKESGEGPIGGGSHGSSSDNDSGSNPRSSSNSPSLTSSGTKNRRKTQKTFKIVQQEDTSDKDNSEEEARHAMPSLMPIKRTQTMTEELMCKFCGISFQNNMMHSVHMGYHGYSNPFKCNHCGDESSDALSFFLHIARKEHS